MSLSTDGRRGASAARGGPLGSPSPRTSGVGASDRVDASQGASPATRRKPRHGFVRRLLVDTRGTATTETVIMIPMFAIVWGCIFYVFVFFQRTIAMRSMTRGHTWAYSYVGCSGSGPGTALERQGGSVISGASSGDGVVDGIVTGLFALSTGHGSRNSSVGRPRVIGGGSIAIRDELYVMCNDVPAGMGSYLASFAGRLLGFS